jgi:hypothetical protein
VIFSVHELLIHKNGICEMNGNFFPSHFLTEHVGKCINYCCGIWYNIFQLFNCFKPTFTLEETYVAVVMNKLSDKVYLLPFNINCIIMYENNAEAVKLKALGKLNKENKMLKPYCELHLKMLRH